MFDKATLRHYRESLSNELAALEEDDAKRKADRAPVALDQQSVGRLSRMDALQKQALAQAESRRRSARAQKLRAAIRRLEEGEFGYCQDCGDDIAQARLDADPTALLCVSCARG